MIQEQIAVFPEIAQMMVDLQAEYNLPINIIVGPMLERVRLLTLEYANKEDRLLKEWLVEKATNTHLRNMGAYSDDDSEDDCL